MNADAPTSNLPILRALRSPAGLVALGLAAVLGAVCAFAPLLNVLGYEAAALTGALSPFICGPLWLRRDELRANPFAHRSPAALWLTLAARGWLALAPVPALLALNALRVESCDPLAGLAFFALIPGGAVALGALAATLIHLLTRRRWLGWVLLVALWLASAASTGAFMALEPPVTAHQPFMGYIAGSIYDEGLGVPTPLILFRAFNAAFILAALVVLDAAWAARRQLARPLGLKLLGVAAAAAAALLWGWRAQLGVEIDHAFIEQELSATATSEHFVVHYSPGAWHAQHTEAILTDHEFRYAQLKAWFHGEPLLPGERVHVYLYPDAREKGRLMGARRTLVARIWLKEIHILYPDVGFPLLKHELAHVFSEPSGRGPLRLSARAGVLPNMGMVEGVAEAPMGYRDELSLHAWSAAMRKLGLAPDLRKLVGAEGFWTTSSGQAYTLMGSFVAFLVERYGVERFLDAYPDADLERAYGVPAESLVAEWERYVDAIALDPQTLALARFYFDRPTIFDRRCARALGALRVASNDHLDDERPDRALDCLTRAARLNPDDPALVLDLAAVHLQLDQTDAARAEVDRIAERADLSRIQRAQAALLRGDLQWRRDPEAAQATFREALHDELPLSMRRALLARIGAIEGGFTLGWRYFQPGASDVHRVELLVAWREDTGRAAPLADYLLGRELWRDHRYERALRWLQAALQADPPLPAELRAEARRLIGVCATATGQPERGAEALRAVADDPGLPDGVRAEARDWLERGSGQGR